MGLNPASEAMANLSTSPISDTPLESHLYNVAQPNKPGGKSMRPNIVFAFADDWGRYASAYRNRPGEGTIHELIETPNFDRIAEEGALFLNAHVPAPSCTPVPKLDSLRQVLLADRAWEQS